MGIGNEIFVFLGPPYHGGKDRNGRPGSREKEIGFERERERERERYRKRKTLRVFQIGELYLRIGTFWEERVALAEILDAMCAFRQF